MRQESSRTDHWLSSHSWCLALSNPGKKGSQFASQLPASGFVLRIFGNTRNLFNPNAFRLGKYVETSIFREGPAQSYQLLAAVLHLGNFEFAVDWNNEDADIVRNIDLLEALQTSAFSLITAI